MIFKSLEVLNTVFACAGIATNDEVCIIVELNGIAWPIIQPGFDTAVYGNVPVWMVVKDPEVKNPIIARRVLGAYDDLRTVMEGGSFLVVQRFLYTPCDAQLCVGVVLKYRIVVHPVIARAEQPPNGDIARVVKSATGIFDALLAAAV